MKRHLLFVALALLLAGSVNAQTIGVYWDEAGTVTTIPVGSGQGGAPTFTGYVLVFVEDVVGGASYALQIRDLDDALNDELLLASAVYPDGLQIGSALTGVEVGFSFPQYGFLGTPVLVSTLTFVNISGGQAQAAIDVLPHPAYGDAVYADGGAVLHVLSPLMDAIANENMTFGNVKSLFR